MQNNISRISTNWAFDLDKDMSTNGELKDVDVINQSIEMILSTLPGERLFNPTFGSDFQLRIFDTMDVDFLEVLIDDTLGAIKRWEDRIIIIDEEVRLTVNPDGNSAFIFIPYIIKDRQLKAEFKRKISK